MNRRPCTSSIRYANAKLVEVEEENQERYCTCRQEGRSDGKRKSTFVKIRDSDELITCNLAASKATGADMQVASRTTQELN